MASTGTRNDGALFDPRTNSWTRMPPSPLSPREDAAAVWTGKVALFWGGLAGDVGLANGASYNPATRSWKLLPSSPLSPRSSVTAIWTGKVAVFIGGQSDGTISTPVDGASFSAPVDGASFSAPVDGASYNPSTRTWKRLPALPQEGAGTPVSVTAAWSGHQLIAWTTYQIITQLPPDGASIRGRQEGAEWAPGQARWHLFPVPPPHTFTNGATSNWVSGLDVLVGGTFCLPDESCAASLTGHAEVFDPATLQWSTSPMSPVFDGANPMASTGSSMAIVDESGTDPDGTLVVGDGIAYQPGANTVRDLPLAPSTGPANVSMVWTGRDLLLWGTAATSGAPVAMKLS